MNLTKSLRTRGEGSAPHREPLRAPVRGQRQHPDRGGGTQAPGHRMCVQALPGLAPHRPPGSLGYSELPPRAPLSLSALCSSNGPLFCKNVFCPQHNELRPGSCCPSSGPPAPSWRSQPSHGALMSVREEALPAFFPRLKGQSGRPSCAAGKAAQPEQMGFSLGAHAPPTPPREPTSSLEREL